MRLARALWTEGLDPYLNMALDEAVRPDPPVLRVYSFDPPGLSLGYFQDAADFAAPEIAELGLVPVRRVTGGSAICHRDDVTFSLVARPNDPLFRGDVEASYRRIHAAVAAALATLGVQCGPRDDAVVTSDSRRSSEPICFYKATRFDLVAGGRKLVGSAQRRARDRVLHHGSIPLARNPLAPDAACLAELMGRPVTFREVAAALLAAFARDLEFTLVTGEVERDERLAAEQLVASRFGTEEWNRRRVSPRTR